MRSILRFPLLSTWPNSEGTQRTQRLLQRWFAGVCVLALALALGCTPTEAEGLLVNVQTDFVPAREFDAVRVSLDERTRQETSVRADDRFGESLRMAVFANVPPGRRRVTVSLLSGARVLTTRTAEFPFTGSYLLNVVLTRSCANLLCGPDESCAGGRCVPSTCITGSEPTCPAPLCSVDRECRTATACADARCLGGVCAEVPNAARCAASETCLPGTGCVLQLAIPDASADVDAFTPVDANVPVDAGAMTPCGGQPLGHVCRPSQGACDVAEVCDGIGSACPADAFGVGECRGSSGACDLAEQCPGNGPQCPADVFQSGTPCRPSRGRCDEAEQCAGDSPHCPPDSVMPSGTYCRTQLGYCDVSEFCDGANPECPPDGWVPNGTPCNTRCGSEACSNGICMGGETCAAGFTCCGDMRCDECACVGCS